MTRRLFAEFTGKIKYELRSKKERTKERKKINLSKLLRLHGRALVAQMALSFLSD